MRASVQSERSERAFRASVRSERSERALLLRLPPTLPAHHLRKTASRFALACDQAGAGERRVWWGGFRSSTPSTSTKNSLPGPPACGVDRSCRSCPHVGGCADLLAYCSSGSHQLDRQSRQRSGAGGHAGQHGHGRGRQGAWARRGQLAVPGARQGRRH